MRTHLFIVLCCLMCILPGCSASKPAAPIAENGAVDITGWNFEQYASLRLDGTWAFYWNRLIDPAQQRPDEPDAYVQVPSHWNGTQIDGAPIGGIGYATYRLHIKSSLPAGTQLGLRLFTFSSAYNLYVNDALIAHNGVPGESAETEIAEYRPQTVYFECPGPEYEITVHVSNFSYARGGFWYSAFLGPAERMAAMQDSIVQREAFLFGTLVIVMMFFFVLYLLHRELRYLLVFSCLCILLLIAVNMVGQLTILRYLPMSFDTLVRLWYSSVVWAFFFLYLFFHLLYRSKLSRVLLRVFLSLAVIQQLFYLLTPVPFFTAYLATAASAVNGAIITAALVIIVIGIKNKQEGAWLNLFGILAAGAAYLHDDMFWTNMINPAYGELHHFGLFIFLFLVMVMQAKRIRRYFDRTMVAELAFRQSQIKPHFLYNALNTVISASYDDTEKARELLLDFTAYLRRSFDFDSQSNCSALEQEITLAEAYVRLEQARFEERIRVDFDIDVAMTAQVPRLMLQPVIENAIRHGLLPLKGGGIVTVSAKQQGNEILFCVADNGTGMDRGLIASILKGDGGGGVALGNINERLKKLYGKGLTIASSKGEGTTVSWIIPLNGKGKGFVKGRLI